MSNPLIPSSRGNDAAMAGAIVVVMMALLGARGIGIDYPGFEAAVTTIVSFIWSRIAAWRRGKELA